MRTEHFCPSITTDDILEVLANYPFLVGQYNYRNRNHKKMSIKKNCKNVKSNDLN